jgi:hypothetical protein
MRGEQCKKPNNPPGNSPDGVCDWDFSGECIVTCGDNIISSGAGEECDPPAMVSSQCTDAKERQEFVMSVA